MHIHDYGHNEFIFYNINLITLNMIVNTYCLMYVPMKSHFSCLLNGFLIRLLSALELKNGKVNEFIE